MNNARPLLLVTLTLALIAGCTHGKIPLKPANQETIKAYLKQMSDLNTEKQKIGQQAEADLEAKNKPLQDEVIKRTLDLQQQAAANKQAALKNYNALVAPLDTQITSLRTRLDAELIKSKAVLGLPDSAMPASDDNGQHLYFTVPKPEPKK